MMAGLMDADLSRALLKRKNKNVKKFNKIKNNLLELCSVLEAACKECGWFGA
jgi:hypothetical protein